jgi:hypothetical protein
VELLVEEEPLELSVALVVLVLVPSEGELVDELSEEALAAAGEADESELRLSLR